MTEEGPSNSDLKQLMINQINEVIELPNKFKNLQNEFNKEKNKNVKLEEKNQLFEKELKILKEEMNEKFRKIKSDHENEIKELKQNFQQLIKKEIKEKVDEIKFELVKTNNLNNKLSFIQIKNKWKEIEIDFKCCDKNCINTNKPYGNCIEGNGFINLIDGENIKYIKHVKGKGKKNSNKNCMEIGLRNNNWEIFLDIDGASISYLIGDEVKEFKIPKFSFNDNDIFGCGLVYPPTNKINELPYIFFTKNGKQIGKSLILKEDNFDYYQPIITLKCCSVQTNFGNNLETKPFIYDISRHFEFNEFYEKF
ncbi:hypothetical protein ACQ4LE_008511 [Meloidogyne hapla]